MEQDKQDGWDDVLEEPDELVDVHNGSLGTRFLSFGTSRRSKIEKPKFSLRGYNFAPLDMKTEKLCIEGQEGTSRLPTSKPLGTMMPDRLENVEEETEDWPTEFGFSTHKANTSVSELLEDLQGGNCSFVRIPASLHQHTPDIAIREQKVSSEMLANKTAKTEMAELLGNTKEDTEDLPFEFAHPTKKEDISIAELLEDLQGRSGYSVRTPASLHQRAPDGATRQQEVSSRAPPLTKASQTQTTELLGNSNEDIEDFPSESAPPTKKANISVAELIEDLQGRSDTLLHQHTRSKDPKYFTFGKTTLAILDQRTDDLDDPVEHETDGTSSEEEEIIQDCQALINKDVKHQTMTDLFQKIFDPVNMNGTMLPMRSTGRTGYCRRMQKIMQMEKDRHAEFLRQYNREQGISKGITVQIMSRSLEGKLAVCRCLFQETINCLNRPGHG